MDKTNASEAGDGRYTVGRPFSSISITLRANEVSLSEVRELCPVSCNLRWIYFSWQRCSSLPTSVHSYYYKSF